MKRLSTSILLVSAVLCAVVMAWSRASSRHPIDTVAPHENRPATTADAEIPPAPPYPEQEWQTSWRRRVETLGEDCDVDVRSTCSELGCATVARTPDLDRVGGWVRLTWQSPSLVAATMLGDLGVVPRGLLPCQGAIERLGGSLEGGWLTRDGPDGTWVTCMWHDADEDHGDVLCTAAAAVLDLAWPTSGPPRHL